MLVVFDWKCPLCGSFKEDVLSRKSEIVQCKQHAPYSIDMVRLPAGPRTHFKFADQKLKK